MFIEDGFEYAAQVDGRSQVTVVEQGVTRETGPVRDYAAAMNRADDEEGASPRAVIGAA